jgi:hypothetical protein
VIRILKPVAYLLAVVYFLVDAVLAPVAREISNWTAERWAFAGLRNWIVSLGPYPTLLLFAVPIIVLEPVKPLALYLGGTGHIASGITVFAVGELLKLVLVERLFRLSRDKLMSIPAFAWAYGGYCQVLDWVVSQEAWQNVRRWTRITQYAVRRYVRALKASRRLSVQSR